MRTLTLALGASSLAFYAVLAACGSTTSNPSSPGGSSSGGNSSGAASSGGTSSGASSGGNTPLPCDVQAVLQSRCQQCHQNPPLSGAPMPLVTWEDTQAPVLADPSGEPATPGEKVYQMLETRIHDANKPMPQPPNAALSAADLATLDNWVKAGAPAGTTNQCTGTGSSGGGVPDAAAPTLNCATDDTTVAPGTPFAWPDGQGITDDYVCYSFTANVAAGTTRHIMGITPMVNNTKIVHHVLMFETEPGQPDTSITTTPAPCSAGGSLQWRIVYGWAPGGGVMQTPPNVGFPYDSTTQFIVQVHYNNIHGYTGQTDSSGFKFCTTDQPVQYDADTVAFGVSKTGSATDPGGGIYVPPHGSQNLVCNYQVPSLLDGIHTFAAFPHMHQLGTAIQTEQLVGGGGGGIVAMGQNIPWSFNNQLWFPIETTLHQGDVVSTECDYTNPTDTAVTFGQNTENEMCYSFTAYYPRVPTNLWSWGLPSVESQCTGTFDGGTTPLPTPDAGWNPPVDASTN